MENIVITIVICVTLVSIVMVISKATIHNSKFVTQKAEWEYKLFELKYRELAGIHAKNFDPPKEGSIDLKKEETHGSSKEVKTGDTPPKA